MNASQAKCDEGFVQKIPKMIDKKGHEATMTEPHTEAEPTSEEEVNKAGEDVVPCHTATNAYQAKANGGIVHKVAIASTRNWADISEEGDHAGENDISEAPIEEQKKPAGKRTKDAASKRYQTSKSSNEKISIKEYVDRMKEGQRKVFFIRRASIEAATSSHF